MENIILLLHRLENTLELILINNPTLVDDLLHMPGLSVRKHDVLMAIYMYVDMNPQRAHSPPRRISVYKKLHIDAFTEDTEKLKENYFKNEPQLKTVEENWTFFLKVES